ncbi:MAG TPA: VCBS repeat-containing protein, partial [Terriglobales bacterium]|nr:VCBS repeat-containing protein [Terriglobales bacterium]
GLLVVAQMLLPSMMWGQFETRRSVPVLPGPNSVAVSDFNHDGKLDMAVASELTANVVSVFLGTVTAPFVQP